MSRADSACSVKLITSLYAITGLMLISHAEGVKSPFVGKESNGCHSFLGCALSAYERVTEDRYVILP